MYSLIYTKEILVINKIRETPVFGGISLDLRGSGAFGGGEKKIGVPSGPQISGASGASFRVACGAPNGFENLNRSMRIPI